MRKFVLALALSVSAFSLSPAVFAHETGDHHAPAGFSELSKKLSPAVVNISTAQTIELDIVKHPKGSPLERFNDFFGKGAQNRVARSLGSGFVIDKTGYIVTNNHVIEGADSIEVAFPDGETYEAKLIGRDPSTDIALLKIETGKDMPFVDFAPADSVQVGEWVIAIGNPLGYSSSVAAGIVSASHRNISMTKYDDFIQTDVAINKGNSGGPLFNMKGEVIGVNTAIVSPTGYSVGLSFSIPSDLAASVVDQLRAFGETRRGYLGASVQEVTKNMAKKHKLKTPHGALITMVVDDGPAAKAGLKQGDLIVSIGGTRLEKSSKLSRIIAESKIDTPLKIEFIRRRKRQTVNVVIEQLEEKVRKTVEGSLVPAVKSASGTGLGITVSELSDSLRRRHQIEEDDLGVLITKVDIKSDASGKLRKGDVVLEIEQEDVTSPEDFAQKMKAAAKGNEFVLLLVLRNGRPLFYSLATGS